MTREGHKSRRERTSVSSQLSFQFNFYIKTFGLREEAKCHFPLFLHVLKKEKHMAWTLRLLLALLISLSVFYINLYLPTPHKFPHYFFTKNKRMQRYFLLIHGKSETFWAMCLKYTSISLEKKIFLKMKRKFVLIQGSTFWWIWFNSKKPPCLTLLKSYRKTPY